MRNLILVAVTTVAFCAGGIALPNVLIAQDTVEEDLESDRLIARDVDNRDGELRNRQEDSRDREGVVANHPDYPLGRRESFRDRAEDLGDRREGRGDRRKDYQDRRRSRRDHQRDFRAHRKVRRDHKQYYSSWSDHRKPYFTKHHRPKHSGRSYRGGRWSIAHRR